MQTRESCECALVDNVVRCLPLSVHSPLTLVVGLYSIQLSQAYVPPSAGASQNSQMLQSVLTQVSDHFNRYSACFSMQLTVA